MEKESKKPIIDVTIRKFFEIKLKSGAEIKKAHLDESESFKRIYFLQDKHLHLINMSTRKITRAEVLKGEDIIYINSNSNNDSLICVYKNGSIIAIDSDKKIKLFKNLNILTLVGGSTNKKKNSFFEKFEIFANNFLDKIIIVTDVFIVLWYKNNLSLTNSELCGSFFNLVKQNELQKAKINISDPKKNFVHSKVEVVFSNNFYLGSHSKIYYVITETADNADSTKVTIIDYLFQFDFDLKFRSVPYNVSDITDMFHNFFNTESIEDLHDIKSKYTSDIIPLTEKENSSSLSHFKIIIKSNVYGNCIGICLNYHNWKNTSIIFFMCETYKFSLCKLSSLIGDTLGPHPEISEIDWIANDMFLLIVFTSGAFCLINLNFQVILLNDLSRTILPNDYYYTPMHYNINKLKPEDPARLIISKQRDDVFFMYSKNYGIAFQINFKSLENRLISINIPNENFVDFLYEIKYFQLYLTTCDVEVSPDVDINMNVFDLIHKYFVNMLTAGTGTNSNLITNTNSQQKMTITTKDLYTVNNKESKDTNVVDKEKGTVTKNSNSPQKTETVNNLIRTFVKIIRIFRSINQIHETNLTIVSYLIKKSRDFFIHLINHQEIWLAVLFINLSEKYLCEYLKLKPSDNKQKKPSTKIGSIIFNPSMHNNLSFDSYRYPNSKVFFSRQRLILIFFVLFEFRNTFALNINVLHFVLAKLLIKKLRANDLLDELINVSRIMVKNYKYLKQENDKIGKDEFVLNSISMSYKNEIFSDIQITPIEREDLNFDFFSEFYSIDEFQNFNETNKNYIKNDETELISDFNYLNNVGVLQKWIIYFTNYLYSELFSDFKNYLDNHFYQTLSKNEANTSPEEKTLSKLIYFNVNFFLQTIQFFLKNFFNHVIQKANKDENLKIFNDFNSTYLPFISPVDIPFMIFEFYIQETNQNQKTLLYEINYNLSKLIVQRAKQYNITIDDALNFIDFLISNGFKFENEIDYDPNNSGFINENDSYMNKMQNYIYSGFLFYIFIIHKLNLSYLLEKERDLILSIINSFDTKQKKECYEYLFLIINGQLRYYLKMNQKQNLNPSEGTYIEIILSFVKDIFYKLLREEPYEIRTNIFDFIRLTPNLMKSYLLEGAIYYEYKNMNKLIKEKLFSFANITNKYNKKIQVPKDINIFDLIISHDPTNANGDIVNILFSLSENESYEFKTNLSICLYNIIKLCLIPYIGKADSKDLNANIVTNNEFIFTLEKDRNYIREMILKSLSDLNESDDNISDSLVQIGIDKIIKGNFENKKYFKFSNNELKTKIINSIKSALIKFLHLCIVIQIKVKMLSLNPFDDDILYVKYLSFITLYERNYQLAYDNFSKILVYLASINMKEIKYDKDKENFIDILKNVHVLSLKYKRNDYMSKKLSDIELKIEKENPSIKEKYITYLSGDYQKITEIVDKIKYIKSMNLKDFSFSIFSDFYTDTMYSIYNQMVQFLSKTNLTMQEPLRIARKKYINLSENMYNITGIPVKFFMDFTTNWNLAENNELYKSVISDDYDDYVMPRSKEKEDKLKLNRRQTPKRKRKENFNRSISKKRRPSTDSLDFREETNIKESKGIKRIKKIPKFVAQNNISTIKPEQEKCIVPPEHGNEIKLINIKHIDSLNEKTAEKAKPSIEVILLKEKFVIIYYIII